MTNVGIVAVDQIDRDRAADLAETLVASYRGGRDDWLLTAAAWRQGADGNADRKFAAEAFAAHRLAALASVQSDSELKANLDVAIRSEEYWKIEASHLQGELAIAKRAAASAQPGVVADDVVERARRLLRAEVGDGREGLSITWGGNPSIPAHAALRAIEAALAASPTPPEVPRDPDTPLSTRQGEEVREAAAKVVDNRDRDGWTDHTGFLWPPRAEWDAHTEAERMAFLAAHRAHVRNLPTIASEDRGEVERADDTAALTLLRSREMQAIGAAISTRNWHDLEVAYNAGRDRLDRVLTKRVLRSRES